MGPAYRISPMAGRDLDAYVDHLLAEADQGVTLRFVECAKRYFLAVSETPKMGPIVPTALPGLTGLRKWRVERFPKMLIFYLP